MATCVGKIVDYGAIALQFQSVLALLPSHHARYHRSQTGTLYAV
ncbi:MAG: hypothetical protein O2890_08615 [Cyanobacteria bacterium]|nr:hypothetical protein [Cyanobacteriota bacterium]